MGATTLERDILFSPLWLHFWELVTVLPAPLVLLLLRVDSDVVKICTKTMCRTYTHDKPASDKDGRAAR